MSKKGYKQTEEHKRKIGQANRLTCTPEIRKRYSKMYKGKKRPEFTGEKHPLWGTKISEKHKKILSKVNLGKKWSKEQHEKMKDVIRVRKVSLEEVGRRISKAKMGKPNSKVSGVKNWNWKGGISLEREKIRHSMEYSEWVRKVYIRNNFTCQKYKTKGGNLVAHHILNFSDFPELRFDVNNGITLSRKAHDEFHKIYGKHKNTREQLEEFINNK